MCDEMVSLQPDKQGITSKSLAIGAVAVCAQDWATSQAVRDRAAKAGAQDRCDMLVRSRHSSGWDDHHSTNGKMSAVIEKAESL